MIDFCAVNQISVYKRALVTQSVTCCSVVTSNPHYSADTKCIIIHFYQLRSSQDHSSLYSSLVLFNRPHFCLFDFMEMAPRVWRLKDLSVTQTYKISNRMLSCSLICFHSHHVLTSTPAIPVISCQDPIVYRHIQCWLPSLEGRNNYQTWKYKVNAGLHCVGVDIPFLSPVSTHTLIPACLRREIVSGTPSWSRSSMAVTPKSYRSEKLYRISLWVLQKF